MNERTDYAKAVMEVWAQRGDAKSKYQGVSRIHCSDGYVDVARTRTTLYCDKIIAKAFDVDESKVNGLSLKDRFSVSKFLEWCRHQEINIYDYHRRASHK